MSFIEIYLIGLAVILGFNTVLWLVSLIVRDSSIVDPFWGILFLLSGAVYFLLSDDGFQTRKILMMALIAVWSLRLSGYLAWRNFGKGEDFRYRKWREENGVRWWWYSYFKVFLLQGVIAWIVSIPLLAAQYSDHPDNLTIVDGVGAVVWLFGFYFEAMGDYQLARFKSRRKSDEEVLDSGVWHYTRHPNYFGDAAQWWGFYLMALAAGGWWTVFSPAFMTLLLLRVSGVVLLEKSLTEKKPAYQDYIDRTPAFIPWFPKRKKA